MRVKWFDRAEVDLIEAGKYLDLPFKLKEGSKFVRPDKFD